MLFDSTGTVQWKAHYTPFGKAIVEVNNLIQNIRFPGQYFDSESGLHYNYFRDYDPEIGRYIQSDPIGLNGGINTYGYALQNPLKYSDRLGLEVTGEWIKPPAISNSVVHICNKAGNCASYGNIASGEFMIMHFWAEAMVSWRIKCTDDDECNGGSWEEEGAWKVEVANIDVSAPVPMICGLIPHPSLRAACQVAKLEKMQKMGKSQAVEVFKEYHEQVIDTYLRAMNPNNICKQSARRR